MKMDIAAITISDDMTVANTDGSHGAMRQWSSQRGPRSIRGRKRTASLEVTMEIESTVILDQA